MVISISLVFLFGLVLFFLLRSNHQYGTAFAAGIFGFFLASTGAAGPINQLATAVVQAVHTM